MPESFIILRKHENGRLSHVTMYEEDVRLVDAVLNRVVNRTIPTSQPVTSEDVFKLLTGDGDRVKFLKDHNLDGYGDSALKDAVEAFIADARKTAKPASLDEVFGGENEDESNG